MPLVTPLTALFPNQSHSIRDNVLALLAAIRAWNCSADSRRLRGLEDERGLEREYGHVYKRSQYLSLISMERSSIRANPARDITFIVKDEPTGASPALRDAQFTDPITSQRVS
jgi:hypothetical protein